MLQEQYLCYNIQDFIIEVYSKTKLEERGKHRTLLHQRIEKWVRIPHEAKDAIDLTENNHRHQKCDTADNDNADLGHGIGSYGSSLPGK